MISINKILFTTDFSECAESALAWAIMLAKNFEAELIMLHAVVLHSDDVGDEVYSRFPDLERIIKTLEDNADTRLETAIPDKGEVSVKQVVRRGIDATNIILEYAETEGVDLIAIGTHGRGGLGKLVLGSTSNRLIKLSRCPVLAVKCDEQGPPARVDVTRIVLPTDFSKHSRVSARYAIALAKAVGAQLDVVHVVDQAIHPSFYAIGRESLLQLDPELEGRIRKATDDFVSELGAQIDYNLVIREGRPAEEIAKLAGSSPDTLVVIASHGAGGLERLMLGSTTDRVLRKSPCPILIVKPGDREFV